MGFLKPNKPNVKKMERDKDIYGLIEALKHNDLDVRREAAIALGEIGDKRAVKPLKRAIEADYTSFGGFSSFEDAVSYGAEMHRRINYFKEAAKKALGKIEGKKSQK